MRACSPGATFTWNRAIWQCHASYYITKSNRLSPFLLVGKQQVLGLCELVKFCEHRPSTMPLRQVISERMPQPQVHVAQHTGFPAPANSPLLRLTAGTGNWSVIRPQNTPGFRAFVRG